MFTEGESCSEGCGFEPHHRILDGHFFTNSCNVCLSSDTLRAMSVLYRNPNARTDQDEIWHRGGP